MTQTLSGEDRRLLRRAGSLMIFFWSAMEVLFTASVVLPLADGGGQALAQTSSFLGPATLASFVFASLLAGASMFLAEKPWPASVRLLSSIVGIGLGILAYAVGASLLVGMLNSGADLVVNAWILEMVMVLDFVLGSALLLLSPRWLRGSLPAAGTA